MQMGTDDEHAGGVSSGQGDLRHGIGEVSDMTGISAFTIRYYDKCGFFPDLARDKRGVRSFSHADIEQLHLVEALRKSGLSIEGIQYYVRLAKRGPSTAGERLSILQERETALAYQRDEIELQIRRLHAAAVDLSLKLDERHP